MSLNYSFVRGCLVDLIGIEPMTSSMPCLPPDVTH
jgi:hypothetical protein